MEALKKNKFLTTYLGVLVGGALILGWFLWSSYSKHKSAREEYDSTLGAVRRSKAARFIRTQRTSSPARPRSMATPPRSANSTTRSLLIKNRSTNRRTRRSSRTGSPKSSRTSSCRRNSPSSAPDPLPGADFDLGMGRYLTEIPRRDTVPHLEFQLDGIKRLVDIMLTDRVASIDSITRQELPIENETPPPSAAAPSARQPARAAGGRTAARPAAAGPALPEDKVLKRYPFTVRMTGSARSIEDVMNHVASSKEHFFATRQLRVENEKKVGPPKGETTASSSDPKDKKDSTVVLGGEKVTASLDIDLIRFLPPEAAPKPPTAADK